MQQTNVDAVSVPMPPGNPAGVESNLEMENSPCHFRLARFGISVFDRQNIVE